MCSHHTVPLPLLCMLLVQGSCRSSLFSGLLLQCAVIGTVQVLGWWKRKRLAESKSLKCFRLSCCVDGLCLLLVCILYQPKKGAKDCCVQGGPQRASSEGPV